MMQSTRRENIAMVAGHAVWRQRARLLLTPRAMKAEMINERRIVLTAFDRMLTDEQADVLERWAENEQVLSGKAATQKWDDSTASGSNGEFSPISDYRVEAAKAHSQIRTRMDDATLEVLSAFTAMQNRHEGALSAALYGIALCPDQKNKSHGFLRLVRDAADKLILHRY